MFEDFEKEKSFNFKENHFFVQYVETALWASTNDTEDESNDHSFYDCGYEFDDVSDDTLRSMWDNCKDFYNANLELLEYIDNEQAGHDFWLSRNGHGAGFFDRGLGKIGDQLQTAAKVYGDSYLYLGDDGKIYVN